MKTFSFQCCGALSYSISFIRCPALQIYVDKQCIEAICLCYIHIKQEFKLCPREFNTIFIYLIWIKLKQYVLISYPFVGFPSCRLVFSVVSCLGFVNVYALRVNLSVALVAMVNSSYSHVSTSSHDDCPGRVIPNVTEDDQVGENMKCRKYSRDFFAVLEWRHAIHISFTESLTYWGRVTHACVSN